MQLPLVLTLAVSGPVDQVRLADVDGDGIDEVVVASRPGGASTDPVALTIARMDGDALASRTVKLGDGAAWWDAGHGLWVVDDRGLRTLAGERRVKLETGLPTGAAAPQHAHLVTDLDQDGSPELVFWARDEVWIAGVGGRVWGTLSAPAEASLHTPSQWGGQVLATTVMPPAVVVGDVDADGDDDVLVLGRSGIAVHRTRGQGFAAVETWPMPKLLTAPDDPQVTTQAQWSDIDGDGRLDLLVHRVVSDGRLAGTQAHLHLFRGTGGGLAPAQIIATAPGSAEAHPVDLDGDGDLDVLVPQVSLDVGNLAQAVLTRTVDVTLAVHPMVDGRLQDARVLHQVPLALEQNPSAWCMFGDLDGDGRIDLATASEGQLRVLPGRGLAPPAKTAQVVALDAPITHLWARDLTGDGIAELVGWMPGSDRVVVVRTR